MKNNNSKIIISFIIIVLCSLFVLAGPYRIDENMEFGENDVYNVTNVNASYFYGDGTGITGLNESVINGSVLNVNSSVYWGNYDNYTDIQGLLSIAWSQITSKFITAVDEIYIYMVGTTATFNETKLNATIDARSDFDTKWGVDGTWVYNNSDYLSWNTTSGDDRYYNQSAADSQFIEDSSEGDLNVNHSTTSGTATTWDGETSQANLNVNASDYWDALGSPSDINASDITDDGTYVKITGDTTTGDIGIKMTPVYELDVNNTIRALNNIIVGNNTGAAGFTGLGDLYALGNVKIMEGLFVEAQGYGSGLEISNNDLATTYTNIFSGNATLNGTTQIIYDSEASFNSTYKGQFLRVISSTPSYTGAVGEITEVINLTHLVVSFATSGGAVIADAIDASYIIYEAPTLFVGDNGVVHFEIGSGPEAQLHTRITNGTGPHGLLIEDTAGANEHTALTVNQDIKTYDGILGVNLFTESSTGTDGVDYAQHFQEIRLGNINNSEIKFMNFNVIGEGSNNDVDIIHITGDVDHIIHQGSTDTLTNAYVESVDETFNFTTNGAGATMFENVNEYVYVGAPVNFTTISFALATHSNKDLALEYYYCNSSGDYAVLSGVTDTTDGMQISGTINFLNPSDRGVCNTEYDATPFVNTTSVAYIAFKRTTKNVQTEPIESLVSVGGSETVMFLQKDMLKLDGSSSAPETCSANYAGAWYYDKAAVQLLWCDGTNWVIFATSTVPVGGTVTSIATSTPITGGTITSTGTIAITMEGDLVTTAPITGGALNIFPGSGTKATIAMPVATTSADGYLSSTDWDTFNDQNGTVTSVATTAPITGGDITSTGTISLTACGDAELYQYNGTAGAWECEAVAGTGTVTSVATDDTYLTGGVITSTGTITFNETLLNTTIDSRSTVWGVDNKWIYNSSGDLSFNTTSGDARYYNISNPNGYYNDSNFSISDYYTSSQIDVFSYYNASDFSIADYSTTVQAGALYYGISNPSGFFNNIANFTGTLTNAKWCLYDGSDIVCNTDPVSDTTYSAGAALTLTDTEFNVTDDSIGNTQLEYDTGQALTTTSDPTFADLTVNNITSVNCITFDSGGKICSGS